MIRLVIELDDVVDDENLVAEAIAASCTARLIRSTPGGMVYHLTGGLSALVPLCQGWGFELDDIRVVGIE